VLRHRSEPERQMGRSAHGRARCVRLGSPRRSKNRDQGWQMPESTNETGQTSVEYALVLALVALVFALALGGLTGPFSDLATKIANAITGAL
jgi:Flp pilus assembly pilin Flp